MTKVNCDICGRDCSHSRTFKKYQFGIQEPSSPSEFLEKPYVEIWICASDVLLFRQLRKDNPQVVIPRIVEQARRYRVSNPIREKLD